MINDSVSSGGPSNAVKPGGNGVATLSPGRQPSGKGPEPTAGGRREPDTATLESAVSQISDYVQSIRRSLSFSIEESTGRTVVKVFDANTDELIRQIPPEETLKIAATLKEQSASLFIRERV